MELYIITKGNEPIDKAFTTRKQAIISAGLSYNNSTRKANTFNRNGVEYRLFAIRVIKIKGRGNAKNLTKAR